MTLKSTLWLEMPMPLSATICLSRQGPPRRMTGLTAQESEDQWDKKEIRLQGNGIE